MLKSLVIITNKYYGYYCKVTLKFQHFLVFIERDLRSVAFVGLHKGYALIEWNFTK